MKFKRKNDPILSEYEVVYLDNKSDYRAFEHILAYSEKQALYKFKKRHADPTLRVVDIRKVKEIPPKDGEQLEMDFGEVK